jgi:hemolysin III
MQKTKSIETTWSPRLGEEIANAITHGTGALLAMAGSVFLLASSDARVMPGAAIYGVTLVVLYLTSTLYHSLIFTRARHLFRKFDHMAIFLLIAGTYTPFCLSALSGWLRWTMLGGVWGCAVLGIVLKSLFTGRIEWLSLGIYIVSGWMVIGAIKPIYHFLSPGGFALLVCGGVAYTVGTIFYASKRIPYGHSIWHVWVLAGSALHFFAVMTLLR